MRSDGQKWLKVNFKAGSMRLDFGSANVPVALAGVPPASDEALWRQLFGEAFKAMMVVGGTPTTAVGTTAIPGTN
jgi:hypothetical protein